MLEVAGVHALPERAAARLHEWRAQAQHHRAEVEEEAIAGGHIHVGLQQGFMCAGLGRRVWAKTTEGLAAAGGHIHVVDCRMARGRTHSGFGVRPEGLGLAEKQQGLGLG